MPVYPADSLPQDAACWTSELRTMNAKGLVNYGSHSRRHTRLIPSLDAASLEDEVRGSRTALERLVGNPVDIFCYPNGDYSPSALNAVRGVYAAAVTTEKGWNDAGMDRHLLRRMSIHDDIARTPVGLPRARVGRSLARLRSDCVEPGISGVGPGRVTVQADHLHVVCESRRGTQLLDHRFGRDVARQHRVIVDTVVHPGEHAHS